MEVRSEQQGIHMGFNNLKQPIQESSSNLLLSAATHAPISPTQTLDPNHPHLLHHHHNHLQLRNSNPVTDPHPPPAASDAAIVNSDASNSRQPPPLPPQLSNLVATTAVHVATPSVQYRECLKNHAASTGGHVVDGCGEYMPSGEENTPEALRCAACDCHRSFHRREVEGEEITPLIQSGNINHSHHPYNINPNRNTAPTTIHHHLSRALPQQQHQNTSRYSHGHIARPVMMAFHGGAPAESSSEDLNMLHYSNINAGATTTTIQQAGGKKRFRTKFRQGQKERMQEFAERLGWKIQKQDDEKVDQFCGEIGVKRQVFKVWMHNNKAAIQKKQHQQQQS